MKVGTPENPEIIEPDGRPLRRHPPGRFRRAFRLLVTMVRLSIPAFALDSVCFWLVEWARGDGGGFAVFLLFLLALPALILTIFAIFVNLVLGLMMIATVFGQKVTVVNAGRFSRFVPPDDFPPSERPSGADPQIIDIHSRK